MDKTEIEKFYEKLKLNVYDSYDIASYSFHFDDSLTSVITEKGREIIERMEKFEKRKRIINKLLEKN